MSDSVQSRQEHDDMDDQDEKDVVDTGTIDAYFMETTKLLEEVSQLRRDNKGAVKLRFHPPRVSWAQRVLRWFRRG